MVSGDMERSLKLKIDEISNMLDPMVRVLWCFKRNSNSRYFYPTAGYTGWFIYGVKQSESINVAIPYGSSVTSWRSCVLVSIVNNVPDTIFYKVYARDMLLHRGSASKEEEIKMANLREEEISDFYSDYEDGKDFFVGSWNVEMDEDGFQIYHRHQDSPDDLVRFWAVHNSPEDQEVYRCYKCNCVVPHGVLAFALTNQIQID